jgi:NADPH:quinone reductase-like Zn-dependent oxidoreductase
MTAKAIPATMRAVEASGFGLDKLALVEKPVPVPQRGEILVQIKAATLNYRDLAILQGTYKPDFKGSFIPGSDGAGTVVAVGSGVTRFKPGDRVVPVYTQGWVGGLPTPEMRANRTLGVPLDGVLRDFIAVPAEDAVATPSNLSRVESATLPIAALTAWTTLHEGRVKPGDWVLVTGTGGVAIFALQFAKLAGAHVVVISSSDDKLAKVRALGADATVNYRKELDWAPAVKKATGGRGADIVVETAGTLSMSLGAAAWGGFVGVIGFTGGYGAGLDIRQLIAPMLRMQGIAVGSRSSFEAMNRAITQHGLRPVIEQTFPLEKTRDAFALMERGGHFGKIAITLE